MKKRDRTGSKKFKQQSIEDYLHTDEESKQEREDTQYLISDRKINSPNVHPNNSVPPIMLLFSNIMSELNIPRETRDIAFKILSKAGSEGLMRGKKTASISAAAIYAACRINGVPRQLSRIALHANVRIKSLGQSYRKIASIINQELPQYPLPKVVERICNLLGAPESIEYDSNRIINILEKAGHISGKDPWGIAGACIYIACVQLEYRFTQNEIAKAAGVTEVTIRNRYKGIISDLDCDLQDV